MRAATWVRALFVLLLATLAARAETYQAGSWNYQRALRQLGPGDTLVLDAGEYPEMPELNLKGRPDAWIVIRGPASGDPATLAGRSGYNTVELRGCSYLAIENLTIDGRGIGGIFGISASGAEPSHHIRIENCRIIGHGYDQSTVAISTKTTAWSWVLRRNTIVAAGTSCYLGNSDGTMPFIGALIENNLFLDSHGYNVQIKQQNPRDPSIPGLPTAPQTTVIRHNVFLKGELPNDSGARPNLLVGALPTRGPGSEDRYEIYGNVFYHNDRESLLQAEGRVSIHDNVFLDCTGDAVHLQNHYGKVQIAYVYNNTFYRVDTAIRFAHPALVDHFVLGNLMFADHGIEGECTNEASNLLIAPDQAGQYVARPSLVLGKMDFYPLPGKCRCDPFDLSRFSSETDSGRDFNGTTKDDMHLGAYSGEGTNPGWQIDALCKGDLPPAANDKTPPEATLRIAGGKATTAALVVDLDLTAADGVSGMGEGAQMRFSNDGKAWSEPEPFAAHRAGWDLSAFGGTKEKGLRVVYARVSDASGNWTPVIVAAIEYDAAGAGTGPAR
jgi:hypothetical protein